MRCKTLLLLVFAIVSCNSELIFVYTVTRHGARNVLRKSANLTESDATGGPTLLPEGQRMCYLAGVNFRNRYLDNTACLNTGTCLVGSAQGLLYGVYGAPNVGFTNYNTMVRSSGLDRAILSANSFMAGMFPAKPASSNLSDPLFFQMQPVPVYSGPDAEDVLIRAYTKCPTYQRRLSAWFNSSEFIDKAAETEEFRAELATLAPSYDTSLAAMWNLYDSFNVWRTFGVGNPMPNITDDQFQELESIAFWLETAKMQYNLTGNLLGGILAADLQKAMMTAINVTSNPAALQVYPKLLVISSHYNTQLGLLSALRVENGPNPEGTRWLTDIPALASALLFELHMSRGITAQQSTYFVRVLAQNGPNKAYVPILLPCATGQEAVTAAAVAGDGACMWRSFSNLLSAAAISQVATWCSACNNNSTTACQVAALQ